ncbi:622_t:CDS:2, partial [Rhizophagus irregularis]
YDLVEKLDEINMEQNEVIINEKMRKNNDAIVDDKKDDIIIEGEDGVIVEDDQQATGKNIRFIPKWYLEHSLSKLLLIADCKIVRPPYDFQFENLIF